MASQADNPDGDTSFSASSDCVGGWVGEEGVVLEAVAPDCALGADAAGLAGSGRCCSGCDPAFCAILGGAGEGDRDELSFERSLSYLFFIDFRKMRVEYETS